MVQYLSLHWKHARRHSSNRLQPFFRASLSIFSMSFFFSSKDWTSTSSLLHSAWGRKLKYTIEISVADPWHFGVDPDAMPLNNGSGSRFGSCYFHHWSSIRQQQTKFKKKFYIYIIFQRQNVKKKSQNSRNQAFSCYFCLMMTLTNESGSRRPKNMWIRIRNGNVNI